MPEQALSKACNFSPVFNLDKVFFYDEPKEINLDSLSLQLSENWLSDLEGLLQQADNLARHLGVYPDLKDLLKIIAHRLEGNLDDFLGALTDSGRQEIIEKLREEIDQCSAGFYNRVNQIIYSFQRPQNLSQLFHQVREVFVKEKVAVSLTNEVHSFNSVTRIAAARGLGVKVNYKEDKYVGEIVERKIIDALKQVFEAFFTPCAVPYLFVEHLHGLLAKPGYTGRKEGNGYIQTEVTIIIETIKAYLSKSFQKIPHQDFFIVNEESYVLVDLDWTKIREYFLLSLVEEGYFIESPKYEMIFNLFDYACFIDLYPFNSSFEVNPKFFESSALYIQLKKSDLSFLLFGRSYTSINI